MKAVIYRFSFLIALTVIISCHKDDERDYLDRREIYDCYEEKLLQNQDPYELILGQWEWAFVRDPDGDADFNLHEGLTLDFKRDSILDLTSVKGTERVSWYFQNNQFKLIIEQGKLFNPVAGETTIFICDEEILIVSQLDPPQLLRDIENNFIRP